MERAIHNPSSDSNCEMRKISRQDKDWRRQLHSQSKTVEFLYLKREFQNNIDLLFLNSDAAQRIVNLPSYVTPSVDRCVRICLWNLPIQLFTGCTVIYRESDVELSFRVHLSGFFVVNDFRGISESFNRDFSQFRGYQLRRRILDGRVSLPPHSQSGRSSSSHTSGHPHFTDDSGRNGENRTVEDRG
jgi:hypothetical protein